MMKSTILIFNRVLQYSAHTDVIFLKSSINKQEILQYASIMGDPDGQKQNYRIPLDDGKSIHIKEYDDHYKIHWDISDLATNPIGHLVNDAPHHIITIAGIAVTGLLIYKVLKKFMKD